MEVSCAVRSLYGSLGVKGLKDYGLDRYKISEDRSCCTLLSLLWMMQIKDTCSELWSRSVIDDINSTVRHPFHGAVLCCAVLLNSALCCFSYCMISWIIWYLKTWREKKKLLPCSVYASIFFKHIGNKSTSRVTVLTGLVMRNLGRERYAGPKEFHYFYCSFWSDISRFFRHFARNAFVNWHGFPLRVLMKTCYINSFIVE